VSVQWGEGVESGFYGNGRSFRAAQIKSFLNPKIKMNREFLKNYYCREFDSRLLSTKLNHTRCLYRIFLIQKKRAPPKFENKEGVKFPLPPILLGEGLR